MDRTSSKIKVKWGVACCFFHHSGSRALRLASRVHKNQREQASQAGCWPALAVPDRNQPGYAVFPPVRKTPPLATRSRTASGSRLSTTASSSPSPACTRQGRDSGKGTPSRHGRSETRVETSSVQVYAVNKRLGESRRAFRSALAGEVAAPGRCRPWLAGT